ncbi:acyloxyacyl hydrolase [Allopusillimonas soli]|nr:acyloxyacyl hydrolase [Allopusillimonas soli]
MVASLLLATTAGSAMGAEPDSGVLSVRAGAGSHYQRLELAWETPPVWSYTFSGGSRLDLVGELGVAYWHADGSRSPAAVWQLNAIPFLRWTFNDRYYLEAGAGATVFSHASFAGKEMSTAFQFGDHIGVGAYITDNSRIGVRLSHFSNAGIKHPNPGLNVLQLLYTVQY